MTYADFKAKYLVGSHTANPEGNFDGQCVSLVRQKMKQVDGVVTPPLGNAVDFATNPTFLKYYEKVSSPQLGDIMIWGNDAGTWTGPPGHDALYDGDGYMYNQNFNGSGKVSRNKIFTPGFIGYYRLKGADMNNTRERIKAVFNGYLGTEPTEKDYAYWLNKSMTELDDNAASTLRDQNAALRKQLANASPTPEITVNGTRYVPSK